MWCFVVLRQKFSGSRGFTMQARGLVNFWTYCAKTDTLKLHLQVLNIAVSWQDLIVRSQLRDLGAGIGALGFVIEGVFCE